MKKANKTRPTITQEQYLKKHRLKGFNPVTVLGYFKEAGIGPRRLPRKIKKQRKKELQGRLKRNHSIQKTITVSEVRFLSQPTKNFGSFRRDRVLPV